MDVECPFGNFGHKPNVDGKDNDLEEKLQLPDARARELVQQLDDEPPRPLAVHADLEEAPRARLCLWRVPIESAGGRFGPEEALRALRGVTLVPAA